MSALAAARSTKKMGAEPIADLISLPVASGKVIYQGALVALLAGYAVPGSASSKLVAMGRAEKTVDNTTGADGDLSVTIRRGIYKWDSYSGDAPAQANVGNDAFIYDDHTVAKTDGGAGARSRAGKIIQVDTDGVWVETVGSADGAASERVETLLVDLASVPAGVAVGPIVMPYGGRITKVEYLAAKAATTASKGVTLQPRITPSGGSATPTTGGLITLTTALSAIGAPVAGTAITGANTFKAGDSIDLLGALNVAAFVEGFGAVRLHIAPA